MCQAWAQLECIILCAAELRINVYLCLATPSLPTPHTPPMFTSCAPDRDIPGSLYTIVMPEGADWFT